MVADKVSTFDINAIGTGGSLTVTLPDYKAIESVKNLVSRAKAAYPREDGMTYTTKVDRATNTITISVVSPDEVNRKNKQ